MCLTPTCNKCGLVLPGYGSVFDKKCRCPVPGSALKPQAKPKPAQ